MVEEPPPLASLPETTGLGQGGWNTGTQAAEAEGSAAGAGNLFGKGDVGVVGGSGVEGGGGGKGTSGLGRGAKGDGTGGGGRLREKRFRVSPGLSAATRSSRAIRSRPAAPALRALRRCAFACWKTAGSARCSSSSRPDFAISISRRWKRSRNGSSSRRAGAKSRYPSGSCCR